MGRVRAARRAREREVRDIAELRRLVAEIRDLAPIAQKAISYIHEIEAPNIKEPFSIANKRAELADAVHARDARLGVRRAA